MANLTGKTISEFPNASALTGAEFLPMSQGGATKKVSLSDVFQSDVFQSMFVVELCKVVDGGEISAGLNEYKPTVTKAGYYPVGLVGFRGFASTYFTQCRVKTASVGSAGLEVSIVNTGAAISAGTIAVNILWMKVT